jgi:hypothetical protein
MLMEESAVVNSRQFAGGLSHIGHIHPIHDSPLGVDCMLRVC